LTEKLKEFAEGLPERRDLKWYNELRDHLRKELNDHADRIEARLHRFFMRALAALAIVGIASAVGLLGFGIVLKKQAEVSRDIQQSRFELQLDNCLKQNERHNKTLTKAEERFSSEALTAVKLLVNELQPYTKNCVASSRNKVQQGGDK
jgi:hypothetical protein